MQLKSKIEKKEIEKTIRKLMVEDEGKDTRESILNLKEKAYLCLKASGSSYLPLMAWLVTSCHYNHL